MIGYNYQIIENLNYVMNHVVSMVCIIIDKENEAVK